MPVAAAAAPTVSYWKPFIDSSIQPPETVTLKDPSEFAILGKPARRYEGAGKVDGTAQFGIDIKLPGMLYGAIARPPVHGGSVVDFDATAA